MSNDTAKQAAAHAAVQLIENGQTVGLGTGSTAVFFVQALGERVRTEGLQIRGIATSVASESLAREVGIPVVPLGPYRPDITVDGADEIDPRLNLIKGGGGALVREKLVARSSKRMVVIADEKKNGGKVGHVCGSDCGFTVWSGICVE
jgi:ribose 5-phosphate isomerase A